MFVETKQSSRVVDYVSRDLPMPVEIIGSSIDVSLSGESTYIDTRKNNWEELTSYGGNDTISPISASMPSNTVDIDASVNGYTIKCVFQNASDSCTVYPLVADSNGDYPGYLPPVELSSIYQNADGKYESEIVPVDLYGYSKVAFMKSGLSGNGQILGVPY